MQGSRVRGQFQQLFLAALQKRDRGDRKVTHNQHLAEGHIHRDATTDLYMAVGQMRNTKRFPRAVP